MNNKIGRTVCRLRKKANISQKQFAKDCGISQPYLRRIESPQNNYSDDELSIRCKMKLEANNE